MANYDQETGIHYGAISQNDIVQAWAEESEPEYGEPQCPMCGKELKKGDDDQFWCGRCKESFEDDQVYGDPIAFVIDKPELAAQSILDSDVMVMKSPYYTLARLCSPCVPNAGDLNTPDALGYKTYCFGHDFFDNQRAPYRVYRVDDDTEVPAPMPDDAITTKMSQLALQFPDHEVLATKVWMNGLFYAILRNNDRRPLFICAKRDLSGETIQYNDIKDHTADDISGFLGLLLQYRLFYEHPIIRKESEE